MPNRATNVVNFMNWTSTTTPVRRIPQLRDGNQTALVRDAVATMPTGGVTFLAFLAPNIVVAVIPFACEGCREVLSIHQ